MRNSVVVYHNTAALGLHLFWQTYPYSRALYVVPVRRTKSLLTASFRFHLAVDTLAVRLYTSSLLRRVQDFHPLERPMARKPKKRYMITIYPFFSFITLYYNIASIRTLSSSQA